MSESLHRTLPAINTDGLARAIALSIQASHEPAELFSYHSAGRALIVAGPIGDRDLALESAQTLATAGLQCLLLNQSASEPAVPGITVLQASPASLNGYLGQFSLTLFAGNGHDDAPLMQLLGPGWANIDVVLDLGATPLIGSALPPPGYYFPNNDRDALATALEELSELIGDFDKPRYYQLDSARCAHARSGITVCRRCLDACPADAIHSDGSAINVDPGLCQGAGICATVCPSGAINYQYPQRLDTLDALRALLTRYREASGQTPRLLFHDSEHGKLLVELVAAGLPQHVLPIELAEAGSAGLDIWLSAMAYGATVSVLLPDSTPASVSDALQAQIGHGCRILEGMGYDPELLTLLSAANGSSIPADLAVLPTINCQPAHFAGLSDKREALFIALDHLHQQAPGALQ